MSDYLVDWHTALHARGIVPDQFVWAAHWGIPAVISWRDAHGRAQRIMGTITGNLYCEVTGRTFFLWGVAIRGTPERILAGLLDNDAKDPLVTLPRRSALDHRAGAFVGGEADADTDGAKRDHAG